MSGKPKPWTTHPNIHGLQFRAYEGRRVYLYRQRHRTRLYIDYLGEMSLNVAVRFIRALRRHRGDPARIEQIHEEIKAVRNGEPAQVNQPFMEKSGQ